MIQDAQLDHSYINSYAMRLIRLYGLYEPARRGRIDDARAGGAALKQRCYGSVSGEDSAFALSGACNVSTSVDQAGASFAPCHGVFGQN